MDRWRAGERDEVEIGPGAVARAVAYIGQPDELDLSENIVRPTAGPH